jgi:CRISPR/Cas system-associated exonuclease Cas4 (RecB family)
MPQSYPLVLGVLTHLFIELYHKNRWEIYEIKNIKDNLDILHEHITLNFLAKDFNSGSYMVKSMDRTKNTTELIEFIKNNEVVFFHAFKLFKQYISDIAYKIEDNNIESEFTFNNIVKLNNEDSLLLYGSIDLIFWKMENEICKYLYLADFKTGKTIDIFAIHQLYFYCYNIIQYNFNTNKNIIDNPDKTSIIQFLKEVLTSSAIKKGIIFKLRDGDNTNVLLNSADFSKFIDEMFDDINNIILPLHKVDKNDINIDMIKNKYNDKFNFVNKDECKKTNLSYNCTYCQYSSICKYRLLM